MRPLIPVRLAYCAAFRAGLTRITRVNHDDGMPGFLGLVFDHLAELVKRPTDLHIPVLYADFFGCVTNALKGFQREERGLGLSADECLRDLMIHVSHPTVFSLADVPEPASCAARPPLL